MKKLIRKITAYRYNELEAYAQDKAKENYLMEERFPEFFSEDLMEELKTQFGLLNLKTGYSLSNCQGDGLCLYGKITHPELFDNGEFRKIAFKGIHYRQIQSVRDELQGIDFKHRSRYYHANTIHIESREYNPTDQQAKIIERITHSVKSWYFSFCREWEKRGYDYFHEISNEEMKEVCDVNDYLFTKEGLLINKNEYQEFTA